MNWIKEYLEQIESGKIVAGQKVIKVYKQLLKEVEKKGSPYYFNEAKGERPIQFIETFCKQAERRDRKTNKVRTIPESLYPSPFWNAEQRDQY